jgi:hypothetical protein
MPTVKELASRPWGAPSTPKRPLGEQTAGTQECRETIARAAFEALRVEPDPEPVEWPEGGVRDVDGYLVGPNGIEWMREAAARGNAWDVFMRYIIARGLWLDNGSPLEATAERFLAEERRKLRGGRGEEE